MTSVSLATTDSRSVVKNWLLVKAITLFERQWLRYVILGLLGFVVRFPALQGDLIWDDTFLARDNPFIKSPIFVFEAFRHHLLVDSLSMHYRPVQNLSYMVDYFFWNTDTYGFHLSNVLWHVGSGLLLFALLQRLLPELLAASLPTNPGSERNWSKISSVASFFVALIWLVHPVHSAAVDYISGRADSLAFFFASGAWLLLLAGRGCRLLAVRVGCWLLAAASLLLALCSRESACMWVIVFLFHLFVFEKRFSRRAKLAVLVGCLAVIGIYAGLRQLPEQRPGPSLTNGWNAPVRAVLMLRALGDYGRLMIFPSNLHMERTVVNVDATQSNGEWRRTIESEYLTITGLFVLTCLIAGAVRPGPGRPLRLFGSAWFILTYLPISNLFELNATVAEHWLYLPGVGFILFVAGCLMALPRPVVRLAPVLACLFVMGLSARSYVRSGDWLNSEVFYTRTLAAGGGSVRVVLNLGLVYAAKGEYRHAEALLRRALKLCPSYLIARNNLADVLQREGKTEEAERTFREASAQAPEARKEYPRTWAAALNVAKMRLRADDTSGALEVLAKARRDYPDVWPLISLESELLRKTRGPTAAVGGVEEFANGHWWHIEAAIALGKLCAENNDIARAEAAFKHASRLDVHDVIALNQSALLRMNQKRFDEAYAIQRRAIARQPDEPRQYLILSDILEKMGRGEEARAALAQVQHLQSIAKNHNPDSGDLLAN